MFSSSGSRLLMAKINVELMSIYMYRRLPFHLCITKKLTAAVARTKATESHAQQYQNSFYLMNPTPAHSSPAWWPWIVQSNDSRPLESCWDETRHKKTSAVSTYPEADRTGRNWPAGLPSTSFAPETNHVAQAVLDLSNPLPQPPKCQYCKSAAHFNVDLTQLFEPQQYI